MTTTKVKTKDLPATTVQTIEYNGVEYIVDPVSFTASNDDIVWKQADDEYIFIEYETDTVYQIERIRIPQYLQDNVTIAEWLADLHGIK